MVKKTRVEKMATAVKVRTHQDGALSEPTTQFCHWDGSFDVMLFGRRNRPPWETAVLKMWHNPNINERSQIELGGRKFVVLHAENVEQRGKMLIVKVGRLIALKNFKVFERKEFRNEIAEVYNRYIETDRILEANIFPHSSDNALESYGVDLRYWFELYTMDEPELGELDRFGLSDSEYEVETVEDWGHYHKIIAKKAI